MWCFLNTRKRVPVTHCDHYRDYSKFKNYDIDAPFTWAPNSFRRN